MSTAKNERASEQIVNCILDEITQGKLRTGEKLPNEEELTNRFGISKAPLREALGALSLLGIIETRQGSGSYVKAYDPAAFAKTIYMYSRDLSMDEIFETRAFIEAEAARLAALRATDDDILNLRTALSSSDTMLATEGMNTDAISTFLFFNNFHKEVSRASHNKFLQQFADAIRMIARRYHEMGFENNPNIAEEINQSQADHRMIFRLIASGDPEGARQKTYEHLVWEYGCIKHAQEQKGSAPANG